jgi:hypothetical protein
MAQGTSVTVSLPTNATAATGNTIIIPVTIGPLPSGAIIESFDFGVAFDPAVLQPGTTANPSVVGSRTGTLSANCTVLSNRPTGTNLIAVSGTCVDPPITTGSGVLFNLIFTVIGTANQTSALTFTPPPTATVAFQFNNGSPAVTLVNGQFTVLGPTAASVSVAGKVTTASGRGITNVLITLTDSKGNQRTATTTSFGYYRFDNIEAGETVTITAKARRFKFGQSTIVRTTNEQIGDANFVAVD